MTPETRDPAKLREQLDSLELESTSLRSKLSAAEQMVEREKKRSDTLARASQIINSSLELDVVLRAVMDLAVETMKAERGFLMLVGIDGKLRFAVARNIEQVELASDDLKISQSIVGTVFGSGETVITTDAQADPRFQASNSIASMHIRSIVCVPLRIKDRTIGVVYLDSRVMPGLFSRQDPEVLLSFANQAAIAIDNARLFKEQQARLREIERLEAFQTRILESIASGVITINDKHTITTFNDAAGSTFGIDPKKMVGRPVRALDTLISGLASLIDAFVAESGLDLRQEMKAKHPTQGELTLEVKIAPLKNEGGVAIAITDITEQRKLLEQHEAELRRSKLIEESFSRYLAPHVVQTLMRNPDQLQLGGERGDATILFADIRSFTAMSAKMRAEDVVELLNQYLEVAVRVVFEHEGLLDKFYGDGLMAVFGPPRPRKDDCARAIRTAQKLQAEVAKIAPTWPFPFEIGVGLASGEVVAGHIGSAKRTDYTVIGDAVNLASRLQAAAAGGAIYLDEATYLRSGLDLPADKMSAKIKGRDGDVTIYALK